MSPNWHDDVFFGIHYDLHAGEQDTELGRELTPEHLEERLLRVNPDWIQCDCKGHAGWTSWPTEVGSTSPEVVKDAVRIHRDVTRKLGIKLGMHYSGVWDNRAIELHPEWAVIGPDGTLSTSMTCRLSSYDDELMIPQMLELVRKYDVDGFWVDGENWAATACWCEKCVAEFAKRTGLKDIPKAAGEGNWEAWLSFHRDLFVEHVTHYADAVHAEKPDCCICSNWMYTIRQPEPVTAPVDYLSGDYDWVWGADRAAVEGRMLDGRGITWDLMAWGFTKTGEMTGGQPWAFKPVIHLCQEVAEVVALGGAVMIYNTPQRTGWLTDWHQDRLGEVAEFCRERKEACFGSKSASEAAVLHLTDHYYGNNSPLYNYGSAIEPIEGALHALLESHISADILTEAAALERMGEYKLVVVPEITRLSDAVLEALEAYADAGGQVILSGAHVSEEVPGLVGCEPMPGEPKALAYLEVGDEAVGVAGPWRNVETYDFTGILAYQMAQQEAAKDTTDAPAVTRQVIGKGSVVAIHGPIFRAYFQGHYPGLRKFLGELIGKLEIAWDVTVEASPRLELVTRTKDGKLVINLINRGAAEMTMPRRVMVDELLPVEGVVVKVRLSEAPASVTRVPDGYVGWEYEDGVLTVDVGSVAVHDVVVVG